MIGFILKVSFLVLTIMVVLNIFAPQRADKILLKVSETIDVEEDTLKTNLDKVSSFTKETVETVSEGVKNTFEEYSK